MAACSHLDQIRIDPPDSVEGCEECLAMGAQWVHLRMCHTCGHIGCCDDSPNRHATAHHAETRHSAMRAGSSHRTGWFEWLKLLPAPTSARSMM